MKRGRAVSLLTIWVILNLLTAHFCPLDPDETYYWMYAQHLDWGYYDHPPAVALLIGLGKDILPGGLGLRFGHVLASAATIVTLWYLLGKPAGKWLWLAAALVFAQPMLNVYGFIATPDGPLLLCTALYLLAYRSFLRNPSVPRGVLWGLTMVGLMYSKYHGVLLIGLTVLPNLPWLLRRPGAWVAALGGIALYLPHLYWQYANDFPSPKYHLQGRNKAYRWSFTTSYLLNQLLIFSPFLLWHYWRALRDFTYPGSLTPEARFTRANRWLVFGMLAFFLYMTKNGHPEAQWTALLSIPLIYLTYRATRDRFPHWQVRIKRLAVATIVVLTLARLLMMAPREWLPFPKPLDHEPWTEQLAARAGDRPVIIENSYRLPSLYRFYTGRPAWAITDVDYRLNQYDLWADDSLYHNQGVVVMGQSTWSDPSTVPFKTVKSNMLIKPVANFQVAKGVRIEVIGKSPDTLTLGRAVPIELQLSLDPKWGVPSVDFSAGLPLTILVTAYNERGQYRYYPLGAAAGAVIRTGEPILVTGELRIDNSILLGAVRLEFGLQYRGMPPLKGQSAEVSLQLVAPGELRF